MVSLPATPRRILHLHVSHQSFGAAFTGFYRLVGPFKTHKVVPVIKTELWDTITRRGVLGNVLMGVIPMLFYSMLNLCVFVFEKVWVSFKAGKLLCPSAQKPYPHPH